MPQPRPASEETSLSRSTLVSAAGLRAQVRPLLDLAVPVIIAELGWMAMGLVDTIMVGPLGPAAIGASGVGGTIFFAFAIFGMGLLLGLDTLVSHAYGACRLDECRRWLQAGIALATIVAIPLTLAFWWGTQHVRLLHLHPDVERLTIPYASASSWGMPFLLAYAAFRRYLQAIGIVGPITFALVSANVVNVAFNWILIYGHLGAPRMGIAGSAWSTNIARAYMAAVLLIAILAQHRRQDLQEHRQETGFSWTRIRRVATLGLPAALQLTLEIGVFAAATALAGRLDPIALAAHQIALNVISFIYMVPLGMSSASAVLVGHHIGRQDPIGPARAGWTALFTISGFMLVVASLFLLAPRAWLIAFTRSEDVLRLGSTLLGVAAVFQLFDGLQTVATGTLRGLGDTRTPAFWNLAGHWMGGLPVGWYLCFRAGWGVIGLWLGLSVGLIIVGSALVLFWHRRVHALLAKTVVTEGPRIRSAEAL